MKRGLAREADQTFSAGYGPFSLRSAFQPIFSQSDRGVLRLEAFEGLLRPFKGGEEHAPQALFSLVEPEDGAAVDGLCRRLHLFNLPTLARTGASLFLNFNPAHFEPERSRAGNIRREAAEIAAIARATGLKARQIVCEITEEEAQDQTVLRRGVAILRAHGFRIAVDDFGAEDSDRERVALIAPDIVKFDAAWVRRFLDSVPGFALLKTMVGQFRERGVLCLFEGLEEHWQVDACRHLGVQLVQGYALARPELAPTTFNVQFPPANPSIDTPHAGAGQNIEAAARPEGRPQEARVPPAGSPTMAPETDLRPMRRALRSFGRRGI